MKTEELNELIEYLNQVADAISNGLPQLKDAVSFAVIDLAMYVKGYGGRHYSKALTFALTIPRVTDLKSEPFFDWMLNDKKHLEYMPL